MSTPATTAPRNSAGYAPRRRPLSARRTSSIDVSWPDGQLGPMRFDARARDIVTAANGIDLAIVDEDAFIARLKADRTIIAIDADPPRAALPSLVGERGGGHLREILKTIMPEERDNATPLYLVLDDISGASLISGWAWSHWSSDWLAQIRDNREQQLRKMEGVCIGFRPGSSALDPSRLEDKLQDDAASTTDLRHPDDPRGWHAFTRQDTVGMRRARRIDVWIDSDSVCIDAAFQDSASTPSGERRVLHEYQLSARADTRSLVLTDVQAQPRVLPFPECTSAPANLTRLVDTPLSALRDRVLEELPGTAGCTHLNDALRSLAEVPALLAHLRRSRA